MRKLKFCANLTMMFQEQSLLQRYEAAKAVGFKAVETSFPYCEIPLQDIVQKKKETSLEQILINTFPGISSNYT